MDNSGNSGLNFQKPYLNNSQEPNISPFSPQSLQPPTDPKIVTLDTMLASVDKSAPVSSTPPVIQNPIPPTTPITPPPPPAPNNSTDKKMIFLGLSAIVLFCIVASIIFSSFIKQTAKKQASIIPTPTPIVLENMNIVTPKAPIQQKMEAKPVEPTKPQSPIPSIKLTK